MLLITLVTVVVQLLLWGRKHYCWSKYVRLRYNCIQLKIAFSLNVVGKPLHYNTAYKL